MNSRIYRGRILHSRNWVAKHKFEYPVYFYAFDIDELDELQKGSCLFGHNRIRTVALHDMDYLAPGPEPIRRKIQSVLEAHGCGDGVTRIMLLTSARFLNYVFNPVSFFQCLRSDGSLRCVIVNVNNTFGDSHIYVLKDQLQPNTGFSAHYQVPKNFHVSPFFDLKGSYDFQFTVPGKTVDVQIQLHKDEKIAFVARLSGKDSEITSWNLLKTFLLYPFSVLITVPRICWQAARLHWQRKLPIYHRPNPRSPMTVRVAPPGMSRRFAMNGVLRVMRNFRKGDLELVLPDRSVEHFGTPGTEPHVRVDILNWDFFWRLATGSDIGLGESYMAGDWECQDVSAFLKLMIKNWECIESERGGFFTRTYNYFKHLSRANTIRGSRSNIGEHYDLSNDFFRLFLDDTMLYSCAWFGPDSNAGSGGADPLSEAQFAKIQRIISKAKIGPDDHVLEIGCGWGAFAIEAVRRTGCRVTGITVSSEQLKLARERVTAAGLDDRISIELCDYRKAQGKFSRIVSIEMLEAVGHENLAAYFSAVDRLLLPGGMAVIQVITIPDARYDWYCRTSDFIRKHIFPGGHLPCLASLHAAARSSQLEIGEVESIGAHYVPTLQIWHERLHANADAAKKLGFDEVFLRKWEFYFAYCEAGFAERVIDDLQFVVRNPHNAHAPASSAAASPTPMTP